MNNKKLLWITRTAIFLALLLVAQAVTKSMGQYVTGSVVNVILLISVFTCGLSSAAVIAVISPFLAFTMGIGAAFIQLVPGIAVGNLVYVVVAQLICAKAMEKMSGKNYAIAAGGLIIASVAKFLSLWLVVVQLLLPMTAANEAQVAAMTAAFTWPQLVTSLIGSVIALAVVPPVLKAIKKPA